MVKQLEEKRVRSSNFELLRIICMFMIVTHHYAVHGGFAFGDSLSFNRGVVEFLSMGGKLGVNVFVLISGYFLCTQRGFRWKSILKFVIQLMFFSIIINLCFLLSGKQSLGLKMLIKMFFPLLHIDWWFASTFFVLNLLAPYLNYFISRVSKKALRGCIALLVLLWSVIPTLTTSEMQGGNLTWFVLLYLIAAYMRKYQSRLWDMRGVQLAVFLFSSAILLPVGMVLDILGTRSPILAEYAFFFTEMNGIMVLIQSLSLFCVFKNMEMGAVKSVNFIAASMFGVYLIHDCSLMRSLLWTDVFKNSLYQDSPLLPVHAAGAIVTVFAVCTGLSVLYNVTVGKAADRVLDAAAEKIPEMGTKRPGGAFVKLYDAIDRLI